MGDKGQSIVQNFAVGKLLFYDGKTYGLGPVLISPDIEVLKE